MTGKTVANSHRAGVYALLAEALAPPPQGETPTRLSSGIWSKELEYFLSALDSPVAIPPVLLHPLATAEELAREYLRYFFLPDGLRIWLVESVYKPWTLDESAEVPFKAETGWLGGDAAAHMQDLINRLGVELPLEVRGMPDHIAVEMEVMSLLAEGADPDAQAIFLAQHLDWLPLLLARCDEAGSAGLYRALLELTEQFIAWDRKQIDPAKSASRFQGFSG